MLVKLLAVAFGGAIGATARYGVHLFWTTRAAFPLGTLTANVIGCLLIGVLMAAAMRRDWLDESARLFLITGLLGSLTTFSTFGYESFELAEQGRWGWAAANVVLNLVVGLGAVGLGWMLTTHLLD